MTPHSPRVKNKPAFVTNQPTKRTRLYNLVRYSFFTLSKGLKMITRNGKSMDKIFKISERWCKLPKHLAPLRFRLLEQDNDVGRFEVMEHKAFSVGDGVVRPRTTPVTLTANHAYVMDKLICKYGSKRLAITAGSRAFRNSERTNKKERDAVSLETVAKEFTGEHIEATMHWPEAYTMRYPANDLAGIQMIFNLSKMEEVV